MSYELVGSAFKVFNNLGYGHNEKYYQRAYEKELESRDIDFTREKKVDLKYFEDKTGTYYLDFLVENKIVVELKVLSVFRYRYIKQVLGYLK